jgi:hypothetical protein
MRRWWKDLMEAWLRHSMPLDGDMTEAFVPREEVPRRDSNRGARVARLEPAGRIAGSPIGLRTFEERGLGSAPPAA